MNFARLNHIFIPDTKDGRDRFRQTRFGRVVQPLWMLHNTLTPEGRFLTVFWMLCGAAGLEVATTQIYALWALVTGLIIASLMMRRFYRLRECELAVVAPTRVTAGEPMEIAICVTNQGTADVHALGFTGPLLPWDGAWLGQPPNLAVAVAGRTSRAVLRARFSARGDHHLDPFWVGRIVPPGLTMGPPLQSPGLRFLVVPRVAPVEHVQLPPTSRYQPGSGRSRGLSNAATEFAGVRPYRPGDRVRDLHARSSARVGYPVVREYRQEYFAHLAVLLEVGPAPERAFEAAIGLTAGVVAHLANADAAIELLVGDQPASALPRGPGGAEAGLDLLAMVEPARAPTLEALDMALADRGASISAAIFVCATWSEDHTRFIDLLARRGLAVVPLLVSDRELGQPERVRHFTPADVLSGAPLRI